MKILPPFGMRQFAGVDNKVDNDLFDLVRVSFYIAGILIEQRD